MKELSLVEAQNVSGGVFYELFADGVIQAGTYFLTIIEGVQFLCIYVSEVLTCLPIGEEMFNLLMNSTLG